MIPRFSNPHHLPESTQQVSRREILLADEENDEALRVTTIKSLNKLLQGSFNVIQSDSDGIKPRKKRNKTGNPDLDMTVRIKEPILFRLVSTKHPPLPISLSPKPPPPPATREPDCEDTELQAKLRREQAETVAVDHAFIFKELEVSQKVISDTTLRLKGLPNLTPLMMVIQSHQPPRTAKPPVPAGQLTYPYIWNSTPPLLDYQTQIPFCQVVEKEDMTIGEKKTRKRRRRKKPEKTRVAPAFWKPNPLWSGKVCGYAMGYE